MNKQKSKFYIGVEGGATKSEAILTDENLKVLRREKGKALNYITFSKRVVRENLVALVGPFLKIAREGKVYAVLGLASLNTPQDEMFYKRLVRSVLPQGAVFNVMNDPKIALEARCCGEKNSILVIAGTGSKVYGESNGRTAASVGWDFVLGDEGSGYDLGLKALRAATRAWDGRGKKTVLYDLILERENSKKMEDFMPKFYSDLFKKNMKFHIASFAPLIDEAIKQNDKVACLLRDEAAAELATGVRAVSAKLGFQNKSFCLGTMGSIWKMPGFEEVFKKQVQKICPKVRFSGNTDSGAWGAVLLAKKL